MTRIGFKFQPDERELYPHLFQQNPARSAEIPSSEIHSAGNAASVHHPKAQTNAVPRTTVGSIVLWALMKIIVLMFIAWFASERYHLQQYWWLALFLVYLLVIFPAYQQYQRFHENTRQVSQETLCAKCKHFDGTGVICILLDEHVTVSYIPCGGERWEAKNWNDRFEP